MLNDLLWRDIKTAPKNGDEFQAWVVTENGDGFWEPRCRFNDVGIFEIFGRIDYDTDGWDGGLIHLTPTHWMPQPTAPDIVPVDISDPFER